MQTGDRNGYLASLDEARVLATAPGAVPEWAEGIVPFLAGMVLVKSGESDAAIDQLRRDLDATHNARARKR